LYGAKRGRPQYSSLIPFPRVGRSGSVREYYGQKRGGKSGLIPFPRVGKRGGPWVEGLVDGSGRGPSEVQWEPATGPRPLLTLLPRIGRGEREKEDERVALLEEVVLPPSKRQSLIPFPRVGRSPFPNDQVDSDKAMTRESRSSSDRAFHRRLLRSVGDFKRRITRRSEATLVEDNPRSSRSQGGSSMAFTRRILREANSGQAGFRRRITKKQSLIPFPRTGKRSTDPPGELERDQVGAENVQKTFHSDGKVCSLRLF